MNTVTVTNTTRATIGWGGKKGAQFKPGDNEVDAAVWAEAKGNKVIQAHLESGALEAEDAPRKTKKTDKATKKIVAAFLGLEEKEALAEIKKAKDVDTLYSILEVEKREPVMKALELRIEELEQEPK